MKKAIAVVAMVAMCLLMFPGLGMAGQDQQPLPPPIMMAPQPAAALPPPVTLVPPPVTAPQPAVPLMAPGLPAAQPQMPAGQGGSGAATVISIILPGAGEWMNRGFQGGFPTIECFLGYLCPFIMWSSALDAAIGDRSERVRIDFWVRPRVDQ